MGDIKEDFEANGSPYNAVDGHKQTLQCVFWQKTSSSLIGGSALLHYCSSFCFALPCFASSCWFAWFGLFGWLVGCLLGWLVGWLVGLLCISLKHQTATVANRLLPVAF